ncbi:MAG TPA: hypothetical protein PLV89_03575 [Treponemataceae bacterium]|nr:hypothetical protein [Treponemataceae bacterium]
MSTGTLILSVIKLVAGGLAAFFAILLWSKTRDTAWMSLVAGTVTSYAGVVYEMLSGFGLFPSGMIELFGIPIASLFFTIVPPLFYIAAFIIMLSRTRK